MYSILFLSIVNSHFLSRFLLQQPVFVDAYAPTDASPTSCLYNMDPLSMPIRCSAKHPHTIRLCLCK
jgi:hypothetical protein